MGRNVDNAEIVDWAVAKPISIEAIREAMRKIRESENRPIDAGYTDALFESLKKEIEGHLRLPTREENCNG